MGSGIVYVKAIENSLLHIGGSGVGGGTLIGLSEKLLKHQILEVLNLT